MVGDKVIYAGVSVGNGLVVAGILTQLLPDTNSLVIQPSLITDPAGAITVPAHDCIQSSLVLSVFFRPTPPPHG